jgi:hypothetical protein
VSRCSAPSVGAGWVGVTMVSPVRRWSSNVDVPGHRDTGDARYSNGCVEVKRT